MIYRFRQEDIVYELFEPPIGKDLKCAIIVFSGLPSWPRNEDFGDNLAKQGFYVLQPRYIGCWESYGSFSIDNCIKTVEKAINFLMVGRAKEIWAGKTIKWHVKEIVLLSSSFGSAIVLSKLHELKMKNAICLCPLTDLKKHNSDKKIKEQDLEELGNFIKKGYENVFRGFNLSDWKSFIKGDSAANPIRYANRLDGKKILLIHGDADEVINISKTRDYYDKIKSKNKVELKIYKGIGHGKKLKEASFDYVIGWIIQEVLTKNKN